MKFKLSAFGILSTLIVGVAFTSVVQANVTINVKLVEGEFKGHAGRTISQQLGASIGAQHASMRPNGVVSLRFSSEEQANAAVIALREQSNVLWAHAQHPEASLAQSKAVTEYHSRMLVLNLAKNSDASEVVTRLSSNTGVALQLKRVTYGNRALVTLPLETNVSSLAALAVAAESDSEVKTAERVRVYRHQWQPNDGMLNQQWSLSSDIGGIRLSAAWDVTPASAVTVAVIDTGIRPHPELDSKRVPGYDMIKNAWIANDGNDRDSDETDSGDYDEGFRCDSTSSWHGTHVAGIIAAGANNNEGIAGVAPNARIMSVRVLGRCGGVSEDVADAIRWAAGVPVAGLPNNPNPARILNLSLGGVGPCTENEQAAIDAALARGASIVVAAGNESTLASEFSPANCKGVITVAANHQWGDRSDFSNFGRAISITAPGGGIGPYADFGFSLPGVLSTLNGGTTLAAVPSYASYSGTSMAAPHVAGVVALMLARAPLLTPAQVLNRLQASARSFPVGSSCAEMSGACGAGLLDAAKAVNAVPLNRGNDVTGRSDRLRLIELQNRDNSRYLLTGDAIELQQLLSGQKGGHWIRTGFTIDTFSYTAQTNVLSIPQKTCRMRDASGAAVYSTNEGECQAYRDNGYVSDGIGFMAALPNQVCPEGSKPVYELTRGTAAGNTHVRTLHDITEINRLRSPENGWTLSRIAFCVPQ